MRVLLIDDDVNLGKVVSYQLRQNGYQVDTATSGDEGLKKFDQYDYDLIISDLKMPDMSGIKVLEHIRRQDKDVVFIIITAYGSIENAVKACQLGADDYLTKPFGQEQLLFTLKKALKFKTLQTENLNLRHELSATYQLDNMVADSSAMQQVLTITRRVAVSDAPVLILGESGTGKELIARAIHYHSPRKDNPLVTVNCPTIPDNLLESELFGHVKGAFTGALRDRKGKFEQAHTGTLFLDEIGDLNTELQAKLLRVLQEYEFERVGGSESIKVNVRMIAATNRDLYQQVQEGQFREDLYYRLSVVPITIPPLRERPEDIPALVNNFIARYSGDRNMHIDPDLISALESHDWPGNVRELENMIRRMITLSESDRLTLNDLPQTIKTPPERKQIIQVPEQGIPLAEVERRVIRQTLDKTGGNQTRAAHMLNIPRHVLLYRMKKLGMRE
ncbi:MAG: sigma-54 dependent transcriptional regulator [candidate division KSB1 bacterium]|nr:sigma-54 dependent transcriptional regulator [candidate division KSB1 bacterium]